MVILTQQLERHQQQLAPLQRPDLKPRPSAHYPPLSSYRSTRNRNVGSLITRKSRCSSLLVLRLTTLVRSVLLVGREGPMQIGAQGSAFSDAQHKRINDQGLLPLRTAPPPKSSSSWWPHRHADPT